MNRLYTIPMSHYCEKARWGLQWAKIPFVEEPHVPGFHAAAVKKAGNLEDSVPFFVTSDGSFDDSTRILKWADSKASAERKLYPPRLKSEIEELEENLDENFGVATRLWTYSYMIENLSLITRYVVKHNVPWYEKLIFPFAYPRAAGVIRKVLRIKSNSRVDSAKIIDETLEEIGRLLSDGRPFLFGEHLTAADITFASLGSPALFPRNFGDILPPVEELPTEMAQQVVAWQQHPAGKFAQKIYDEYRLPRL